MGIGGGVSRDRGPVIAIDLLETTAACIVALSPAGGVIAFLGGSDHAIELERVARRRLFAGDAADIGLIGVLTGDAVTWFLGESRRRRAGDKARSKCGEPKPP